MNKPLKCFFLVFLSLNVGPDWALFSAYSSAKWTTLYTDLYQNTPLSVSITQTDSNTRSYRVNSTKNPDFSRHLYSQQFYISAFGGTSLMSAHYATLLVNNSRYGLITSGGVGYNKPNSSLFSLGEFNYFNSFLVLEATSTFYVGLFKNALYLELGLGANHARGNLNSYWFYYPSVALSIFPEFDPFISSRDREKYVFRIFSNLNIMGESQRTHHNEFIGLSLGRRIGKH